MKWDFSFSQKQSQIDFFSLLIFTHADRMLPYEWTLSSGMCARIQINRFIIFIAQTQYFTARFFLQIKRQNRLKQCPVLIWGIRHAIQAIFLRLFVNITHLFLFWLLLLLLFVYTAAVVVKYFFHWRVAVWIGSIFHRYDFEIFDKSKSISLFMLLVTKRISARVTSWIKQSIFITFNQHFCEKFKNTHTHAVRNVKFKNTNAFATVILVWLWKAFVKLPCFG